MRLLILDTLQIQNYVFGSNRLRENIGGSFLVAEATGKWALEALPGKSNLSIGNSVDPSCCMESDPRLDSELIYAAGGNVIALFRNTEFVRKFNNRFSKVLLENAPGLIAITYDIEFDFNSSLKQAFNTLFSGLQEKKAKRKDSQILLGLSVTEECRSTRMPATDYAKSGEISYPAGAEVMAKVYAGKRTGKSPSPADERLRECFKIPERFRFPHQLDMLGRSENKFSYIGVVHADGDNMGEIFEKIRVSYPQPSENRKLIEYLRNFSGKVKKSSVEALRSSLQVLVESIDGNEIVHKCKNKNRTYEIEKIELALDEDNNVFLPIRPILFGGDDIVFICDGRIALSFTIEYLKFFEAFINKETTSEKKITASAGIAIVKSHYPFYRAYELAGSLCRNAKKYRKSIGEQKSCLDWHFASGSIYGSVETIRSREYINRVGRLHQRPVTIDPCEALRSWEEIREALSEFQSAEWFKKRNKMKALRSALREGPDRVEQFCQKYLKEKYLPNVRDDILELNCKGWFGDQCAYFDALELSDFYVPLKRS